MLTKQQVFNKVVEHLAQQGCRATKNIFCMYRTPDGKKCAIGIFIPNSLYDVSLEGKSVFGLPQDVMPELGNLERSFLCGLQHIHDNVSNWTSSVDMRGALATFARIKKLDPSIIDKVDWSKLDRTKETQHE